MSHQNSLNCLLTSAYVEFGREIVACSLAANLPAQFFRGIVLFDRIQPRITPDHGAGLMFGLLHYLRVIRPI